MTQLLICKIIKLNPIRMGVFLLYNYDISRYQISLFVNELVIEARGWDVLPYDVGLGRATEMS